jgi:ribonucleotide monophosphatase NagD (HAD superfamily)
LTKQAVNRIHRTGKAMGFDALVLTTIGHKTRVERTTPVGRFPGKDGSWLIVNCAPEEAVMLGDDARVDIAGANRLGIATVLVIRPGSKGPDDEIQATFTVTSLAECRRSWPASMGRTRRAPICHSPRRPAQVCSSCPSGFQRSGVRLMVWA